MILQTETNCQSSIDIDAQYSDSWQQVLANVVRDPNELFDLLNLDKNHLPAALAAMKDFPLRVPRPFIHRMKSGDWNDPLLKQVLPKGEELAYQPGFSTDPLQEAASNPIPGMIHKYQGRVLLIISGGCAINCRYCFRRHFPYSDNNPSRQQWQQALDYIANDNTINEVIFSGGDPLAASDNLLKTLTKQIASIRHIKKLRIHTRMPIVIPQRISAECLAWLTSTDLKPVMVIHSNHANELDENVFNALQKLHLSGVTLLNQSVLLKGINNNVSALQQLSERLFECHTMPYYLHLLDRVKGAADFEVSEQEGVNLIKVLQAQLPGYLVPKLVKEQGGKPSKTLIPLS